MWALDIYVTMPANAKRKQNTDTPATPQKKTPKKEKKDAVNLQKMCLYLNSD